MQSFIFIHLNKRFVRINLTDIRYVLSVAHHVNIFTDHGELMPHLSLKQLEEVIYSRQPRYACVPRQNRLFYKGHRLPKRGEVFFYG